MSWPTGSTAKPGRTGPSVPPHDEADPLDAGPEKVAAMNGTFSPIGPWPLVAVAALLVTVLTVWAYRQRMRTSSGRWRWFALGLRLAAILLCVLASLRPSVVL